MGAFLLRYPGPFVSPINVFSVTISDNLVERFAYFSRFLLRLTAASQIQLRESINDKRENLSFPGNLSVTQKIVNKQCPSPPRSRRYGTALDSSQHTTDPSSSIGGPSLILHSGYQPFNPPRARRAASNCFPASTMGNSEGTICGIEEWIESKPCGVACQNGRRFSPATRR